MFYTIIYDFIASLFPQTLTAQNEAYIRIATLVILSLIIAFLVKFVIWVFKIVSSCVVRL